MNNSEKIINSFYLQDELNPDIWETDKGQKPKIKSEIREKLLKAAELFLDYLDVDFFVHDIILIGSLVGYNWSEYSDFDVHVIYDSKDFDENEELYKELFKLKKVVFNASHNILIKGFEVELFAQDLNEKEKSVGSYSLMNNSWIRVPEKENFVIDKEKIKEKAEQWMSIIDGVLENAEDEDIDDAIKLINKYKKKISKYRTCGLEREGEYSYENLVFKYLRRNGYIQKLKEFSYKLTDKILSLEQENIE